jgi:hypothetical protein
MYYGGGVAIYYIFLLLYHNHVLHANQINFRPTSYLHINFVIFYLAHRFTATTGENLLKKAMLLALCSSVAFF